MHDQNAHKEFYDDRKRYQLTPRRYTEVASIQSIKKLFNIKGKQWKKNRTSINYVDLGSDGCRGTKEFSIFLEKTTGIPVDATGLDASDKCKASCKKQEIDFIQLDLGSQSIPMCDIQVFTLFETIEHIFETDFLLKSIRKAISQDGVLLVTTLNVVCWKNRILVPLGIQPFNTEVSTEKLSYGYKSNYLKKKMETWKPAGHIRPFTLHSLCELLEDNGFRIISCHGLENWRMFKILETLAKNMCTGILVVARPS